MRILFALDVHRSLTVSAAKVSIRLVVGVFSVITHLHISGYWSGLLASTDFTGQKLQQCLDIIHSDIVSVWNIHDSANVSPFDYRISSSNSDILLL
jgi:hypothetical protein